MIIIPDIHGRNFWKEEVAGREEDIIVFLGDYLDPYPHDFPDKTADKIWEQTWNNFNDIIEFKKKHPSNVMLLLGNHDLHYIYPKMDDSSRYDYERADQIKGKFNENKDIFLLAYERTGKDSYSRTPEFINYGRTNGSARVSPIKTSSII